MTPTPQQPDVRELAAKMIADEFCDEAYYVSWEKLPERNRDFYRTFAAAVLAAVTPVIRRQVAEEIVEAIEGVPSLPIGPSGDPEDWAGAAAAIARSHSTREEQDHG